MAITASCLASSPEQGGTFESLLWTEEEFETFTIINANNDSFTWEYEEDEAAARLRSNSDRNTPKDDWFISPGINLEAGKEYKITLWMRCRTDSKPEVFELKYGTSPTAEAMTTTIFYPTSVVNTEGCKYVKYLTVDQTATYYIGTHGMSPANRSYLYFDYLGVSLPVDLGAPAAPTALTIVPDMDGEGLAILSWTAPLRNVRGVNLSGTMNIDVLRDDEIVKSFTDVAPGQQMTWTDDFADYDEYGEQDKNGYHTWTIVTSNSAGPGKTISGSAYIGINVPGAPGHVTAVETDTEGEVTITWQAPAVDRDGNPMNEDFLTYNIYDITEGTPVVVTTGIDGLSHTYTAVTPGSQDFRKYMVCAATETGEGEGSYSDMIAVGTPYAYPYRESMAQGSIASILGMYNTHGSAGWALCDDESIEEVTAQDGDGGYLVMQADGYGHGSSLMTGKISLVGAEHPILSAWTYHFGEDNNNLIEMEVISSDGIDPIAAHIVSETGPVDTWNQITADLSPYIGRTVQLSLPCTVYSYSLMMLDNLEVKEDPNSAVQTVSTEQGVTIAAVPGGIALAGSGSHHITVAHVSGRVVLRTDLQVPQTIAVSPGIYVVRIDDRSQLLMVR